jgi:hypothetical protein
VSVQSNQLCVVGEPKSQLDRHAIHAAGRLLTTGVWLEGQLRSTAQRGVGLVEWRSWPEPAGCLFQKCVSTINQPRNEES